MSEGTTPQKKPEGFAALAEAMDKNKSPEGGSPDGGQPQTPSADQPKVFGAEPQGQEPPKASEPKVFGAPAENKPEPNTDTVESKTPQQINDEIVLNYLKEKGVSVEGIDQIRERVGYDPNSQFANDELKSMNDWIKETGRTVGDYMNFQAVDFNSLSDIDAIKRNLEFTEPFFRDNPEALQHELQKFDVTSIDNQIQALAQKINDESDTDDKSRLQSEIGRLEYNKKSIEFERQKEAARAKGMLNDLKSKIAQPVQPAISPEVKQQHLETAKSYAQYNAYNVKIGDNNVSIPISPQESQVITNTLSTYDPAQMKDRASYDKAYSELAKVFLFDKALESAVREGIELGKKGIVMQDKNITLGGGGQEPKTPNKPNVMEALRNSGLSL